MTPKQRAIGVVAQIGRYSPSKEIQGLIEEAITAAITEEREVCAKIANNIAADIDPIGNVEYKQNNPEGYAADQHAAMAVREVAIEIRSHESKGIDR